MAFVRSISPDPTLNELILTKGTIFFLRNNMIGIRFENFNDAYKFVSFYICDAFLMAIYVLGVHSL